MSIEVILKEHVEHLGRRGDIVKVASGYARNFLFPRQLALVVTSENRKQIERERAKAEAKDASEVSAAQSVKSQLEGLELAIARRISGTCAKHQRALQIAIARARQLALIPYVTD